MPKVDNINATTDFLDIPMDGLKEMNELDDYLSHLSIEKVADPIKWWWDHR